MVVRIAQERGGRCVSSVYVNSMTKLTWECAKGHQWEAIPNSILKIVDNAGHFMTVSRAAEVNRIILDFLEY